MAFLPQRNVSLFGRMSKMSPIFSLVLLQQLLLHPSPRNDRSTTRGRCKCVTFSHTKTRAYTCIHINYRLVLSQTLMRETPSSKLSNSGSSSPQQLYRLVKGSLSSDTGQIIPLFSHYTTLCRSWKKRTFLDIGEIRKKRDTKQYKYTSTHTNNISSFHLNPC